MDSGYVNGFDRKFLVISMLSDYGGKASTGVNIIKPFFLPRFFERIQELFVLNRMCWSELKDMFRQSGNIYPLGVT